jgi:hypothetical protein
MSQSQKPPVSEVIGNTESFIHRVIDIRRRAAELSEQAARLQEEAYLAAVRDLGTDDGPMAFALACRGLGVDPALRSGFQSNAIATVEQASAPAVAAIAITPAPALVEPVLHVAPPAAQAVAPPRAESVAPPAAIEPTSDARLVTPQTSLSTDHDDPSRLVRYGVAIKRSKLAEAEEVIDQARRTAAQNRKSNPYSDDRGRNAWRNTLFAAVLTAEGGAEGGVAKTVVASEVHLTEVKDGLDASVVETQDFVSESNDGEVTVMTSPIDVLPHETDVHVDDGASSVDDVLDDASLVTEIASQSPVLSSRAVTFTNNPVQSSPQVEKPAPAPPPMSRQSNPFSRSVPAPATSRSTPEVHVDRPVQNRTVAHGQAVPMPKSLKDAIRKIDDETPSAPTISPPPFRRAPSFVPRS